MRGLGFMVYMGHMRYTSVPLLLVLVLLLLLPWLLLLLSVLLLLPETIAVENKECT